MFVAGVDRERDIYPPILGIHRPYLSASDLKRLNGNEAIATAAQMRKVVEDYLKEMNVPTKYVDLMFAVPKDDVRFIDEDDFVRDLEGYIPELRDWLDAKCNSLTGVKKGECIEPLLSQLREDAGCIEAARGTNDGMLVPDRVGYIRSTGAVQHQGSRRGRRQSCRSAS
jgi:hypothetical protein